MLAPDVVLIADGGGRCRPRRHPMVGADKLVAVLTAGSRFSPQLAVTPVWLNGAPAGRIDLDGELDTAVSLIVEDGRITRIYAIRNPHKLARLDNEAALTR